MSVFFYQYKELFGEETATPPKLHKKIKYRYFLNS